MRMYTKTLGLFATFSWIICLMMVELCCTEDGGRDTGNCPGLCKCTTSVIDCSGKSLNAIPKNLPSNIFELNLENNNIESVDTEDAGNLQHFQEINLSGNRLAVLPKLLNLDTLKRLSISRNKIYDLNIDVDVQPSSLQYLDLSYNNLTSISELLTIPMPNLTRLKLNHNKIKILSSFTRLPRPNKNYQSLATLELQHNEISTAKLFFMNFPNLKKLLLSWNKFQTITPGVLVGVDHLESLYVDNNLIEAVTNEWFYMKESLQILNASFNKIHGIDTLSFSRTPQMRTIDLSNNYLTGLRSNVFSPLPHLESLYLHNNKISDVDVAAFYGLTLLKDLSLHHNFISLGDWELNNAFRPLQRLRKLDLGFNNIMFIPEEALKGLYEVQWINLIGNDITTVLNGSFSDLLSLKTLYLHATKMICDCSIRWLVSWIQLKNLISTVTGTCQSPVWLSGRSMLSVNQDDLLCASSVTATIKPTIIVQPKTQQSAEYSNVTLQCVATSKKSDAIQISWYRNGNHLTNKKILTSPQELIGQQTFRRMSELTIHKVLFADAGEYKCHVSNKFGTDWSTSANLSIYVYPVFVDRPIDIVARSDETIQILCSADGFPVPTVRLTRMNEADAFPAVTEKRFWFDSINHRFGIRNLKIEDSGLYVCHAYSSVGSINSTMELTVREQPKFIRHMGSKTVVAGSTSVFECIATGNPLPKVTWYKNGIIILPNNDGHYLFTQQLLIILETHLKDAGVYSCEIINSLGKARQRAKLVVVSDKAHIHVATDLPPKLFIGAIIVTIVATMLLTSLVWVVLICVCKRRSNRSKPPRQPCSCERDIYQQVTQPSRSSFAVDNVQSASIHRIASNRSEQRNKHLLSHNGSHLLTTDGCLSNRNLITPVHLNACANERESIPLLTRTILTDNVCHKLSRKKNDDEQEHDCHSSTRDKAGRCCSDIPKSLEMSDIEHSISSGCVKRPSSTAKRKNGYKFNHKNNVKKGIIVGPYLTSSSGIESDDSAGSCDSAMPFSLQSDVIADVPS